MPASNLLLFPHFLGKSDTPVTAVSFRPIESHIGIFDTTPERTCIRREFAHPEADCFSGPGIRKNRSTDKQDGFFSCFGANDVATYCFSYKRRCDLLCHPFRGHFSIKDINSLLSLSLLISAETLHSTAFTPIRTTPI
jgi:hypothetical protein